MYVMYVKEDRNKPLRTDIFYAKDATMRVIYAFYSKPFGSNIKNKTHWAEQHIEFFCVGIFGYEVQRVWI